jgi:hypothetical protein
MPIDEPFTLPDFEASVIRTSDGQRSTDQERIGVRLGVHQVDGLPCGNSIDQKLAGIETRHKSLAPSNGREAP